MHKAGRIIRRIIVILLIISLIGAGSYYGVVYLKKNNEKEIVVVEVADITSGGDSYWYGNDSSLDGDVVTNVMQNIRIDKDVIIDELLVAEGDEVKKGDKLMTFDLTLVDMELFITQLKLQQQEQDLANAERRLRILQSGGPVTEDDMTDYSGVDTGSTAMAVPGGANTGGLVAAAFPVLLAADLFGTDEGVSFEDELTSGDDITSGGYAPPTETYVDPSDPYGSPEGSEDEVPGGSDDELSGDVTPTPELPDFEPVTGPTPTPAALDPAFLEGGLIDGAPPFYQVLDYDTEPFTGSGTEDDPFIFLCSNARGFVTVKGSFFNKMAGYNDDGSVLLKPGGYWYTLEFHEMDTIEDFADRTASSIGYYYINGDILERPVNPFAEVEFTQQEAQQYIRETEEEEFPEDEDFGFDDGGGDAGITRAEAIKAQEARIRTLNISIKETNLAITKLEKKASMHEVFSMIDGVISYVGDPVEGTRGMESFLRITSAEGYYIRGYVNEMLLDRIEPGTILTCMTDMGEEFEAEVISVADYPASGDNYFGWGTNNPNSSYYSFTANILEEYDYVQLNQDTYLMSMNLPDTEEEEDGITIPKAFVRTQNGVSYVYKDNKGTLKRQAVRISSSNYFDTSVTVSEGITLDDWLAFPYSSDAVEGVKTRRGSPEDLYSLY